MQVQRVPWAQFSWTSSPGYYQAEYGTLLEYPDQVVVFWSVYAHQKQESICKYLLLT